MNDLYRVYVKLDSKKSIISVNSSAFLDTVEEWLQIDEGVGDRYHHAQSNYFDLPIYTADGFPRYKLVEGKAVERTEQELDADRLPNAKTEKIKKSKADLEAYLLSHPLTWTDGEQYSMTEEKQNQLTSTLMAAQLDGKKPEWNTSGGVCKEWELSELSSLAIAIKNCVKILVKYQQSKEIEIQASTTIAEVEQIEIDYCGLI